MLKEFIPFFDTAKYRIVKFFEYVLNSKGQTDFTFDEIKQSLGFSIYQCQSLFADAQQIAAQINGLQVNSVQNKQISVFGLDTQNLKQLTLFVCQRSLKFQLFLHLALGINGTTGSEFQANISISRATYYREKKDLLAQLEAANYPLPQKNEAQLRIYLLNTLYYFSFILTPSRTERKIIVTTTNKAIRAWNLSPSIAQHELLLLFTTINYYRDLNGHQLNQGPANSLLTANHTEALKNFTNYLVTTWQTPVNATESLTKFYREFLISTEMLPLAELQNSPNYAELKRLSSHQFNFIARFMGHSELETMCPELWTTLVRINAQALLPAFLSTHFINQKDVSFSKKEYPKIDYIAKKLVILRKEQSVVRSITENEEYELYCSYFYAVFAQIPFELYSDVVHISVDTSREIYTNYYKKILRLFSSLNIVLDKTVTNQTDIYISNHFDSRIRCSQLIWDHPMQFEDYIILKNKIQEIRKQKQIQDNKKTTEF